LKWISSLIVFKYEDSFGFRLILTANEVLSFRGKLALYELIPLTGSVDSWWFSTFFMGLALSYFSYGLNSVLWIVFKSIVPIYGLISSC
jgi:hypothetical protein